MAALPGLATKTSTGRFFVDLTVRWVSGQATAFLTWRSIAERRGSAAKRSF